MDRNDTIIRPHVTMEEAYRQNELLLRGANLIIVNSEGKLWIPRRRADKKTFPGALDFSAGGHVQSGESYLEGILRETLEEINLMLDTDRLTHIYTHRYERDNFTDISFFAHIFEYLYDGPIELNPDDISEAYWMSKDELRTKLSDPGNRW